MNRSSVGIFAITILSLGGLLFTSTSWAEDSGVRNGHVWEAWYVHVEEPQMDNYMSYLKRIYRLQLEGLKKEGLIVSYKIITSSPTSPDDWNVGILYEYENMAAFDVPEAVWDKVEAKAVEGIAGVKKDFDARWSMRRVIGKRVYREVLLN